MIALLAASLALAGETVPLQPGVPYAAGARVEAAELGVSFAVPARWKGQLPPGADVMLLGSDTEAGIVLVSAEPGQALATTQAALSEPMPIDMMTILQPAGPPEVSGQTLRQHYTHATLVGYARAKVLERSTIVFLAVGPASESERVAKLADTLLASVRAVAAPQTQKVAAKPPSGALAQSLKGRKVYYLKSSNGFSDEWSIHLCSDGHAIWSGNSSAMSGGASTLTYADQSNGVGQWTMRGSDLFVQWNDGSHSQVPIVRRGDGSLGVNKPNHWVRPQTICP